MQIKLVNCISRLAAKGIDMNTEGALYTLTNALSQRLAPDGVEYDFPPLDYILINIPDGSNVPDLSDFGDVVPE